MRWLEVAELIGDITDMEERLMEIRNAAIQEEIRAIDEQIAAQQQLINNIERVSESIRDTFGKTIEDIRLDMMSGDEQYDFHVKEAERLAASLHTMTDPELIRQTMEEINRHVGLAYGVLSDEQQQIIGEDFIKFLEETLAIGETRLDALSEEAINKQEELDNQRAALMESLADRMEVAAAINTAAAGSFQEGAELFAGAAQMLQNINITIQGGGEIVGVA